MPAPIRARQHHHLMPRPGAIASLAACRNYGWRGPMLTDSGGFRVMSLSELRERAGRHLRSHIDGARVERRRNVRSRCSDCSCRHRHADGRMRLPAERADIERAMQLSLLGRTQQARVRDRALGNMLLASSRVATCPRNPRTCARWSRSIPRLGDGACVGERSGHAGHDRGALRRVCRWTLALFDGRRPEDLLEAVARGIDMFDCVMHRNGRHGMAFSDLARSIPRNGTPTIRAAG